MRITVKCTETGETWVRNLPWYRLVVVAIRMWWKTRRWKK